MKFDNPKLVDAIADVLATGGIYECQRTGRRYQAMPESCVVEELLARGWRNITGRNNIVHGFADNGFTRLISDASPNSGVHGEWAQVFSDGRKGRRLAKYQTLITL